ncbi:DNA methyltransferase 1-associated protein 1-like [Watersipora subatra]|uniref:DNA methyltransferase 1-associated protein 1-like n=1 Tax=Watersipora subatra TaxID=2589382 RepID=UPI00355B71A1
MHSSSDVMDILEMTGRDSKKLGLMAGDSTKKPKKPKKLDVKKPEGMHRELWGLLWTDNMDAPPVIPTESTKGYKAMKAKLGISKVRPWSWMPFQNPARKDAAIFYHWRRNADEGKDYPFAAFNKTAEVMEYTDNEYQLQLSCDGWSRAETDHLMELAKRFDLRYIVMHDRWNTDLFPKRSVEDIKERYYNIANTLLKIRAPAGQEPRIRVFDGDHERRRKQQLINLYDRTEDEVDEEQDLLAELKKIEMRKKEREKKTADLQKLISAAETQGGEQRKVERKYGMAAHLHKKKHHAMIRGVSTSLTPDTTGIRFTEVKQAGVTLRSARLKLPNSVAQKKAKAIEHVLEDLGIDINPIATEEIISNYNELRQDIVLLYELKLALANCEYELQTLKHRLEAVAPGRSVDLPASLNLDAAKTTPTDPNKASTPASTPFGEFKQERKISESIDLAGGGTPNRKRRAALEQGNILKKMKQKY